MNEIRFYKKFLKYRELLLQCLNIEKMKDDLRKIGLTFVGAALLGMILNKADVLPGLILLMIGLYLWYRGLIK
jgi:hypothetical protein